MSTVDRESILQAVTAELAALDPDAFESATEVYGDGEDSDGQDDDIETSYDLLAEHDCSDPGGHLFLASCGNPCCVHCGREA